MKQMNDKLPIILLEGFANLAMQNNNMKVVDLELNVFNNPLYVQIGVRDCPATLADIVPMARALSTKITNLMQKKVVSDGFAVPCRKGCTACCYHLICLSVPEALRLTEEMLIMPLDKRKKIMQSSHRIAEKVQKKTSKIISLLNNLTKQEVMNYYMQLMKISDWYFDQKLPCPFLHNNLCMIYECRPIVCIQHLVADSTSPCSFDYETNACKVQMPISIANVLTELSSELEHADLEPVILPCIFDWYEENCDRHKRTWPAPFLVERFIDLSLKFQERKNTTISQVEEDLNILANITITMLQNQFKMCENTVKTNEFYKVICSHVNTLV